VSDGPIFSRSPIIPIIALVLLTGALYTSVRLTNQGPSIRAISPSVAYPGDELVITGSHFGKHRDRSHVSIAGVVPTSSSYQEWSDGRISVAIPEKVTSGLVYVVTGKGQSDGVLFTNKQNIPTVVSQAARPGQPYIQSIDPTSGPPGTLITITGRNFGINRGNGTVTFPWVAVYGTDASSPEPRNTVVAASARDFDYVGWSDQEITVRIPDGAVSGNVIVTNDKGSSNATYLEVSQVVGTKTFRDRRSYAVHYGVDVSNVELDASKPAGNSLYLWLPRIQNTPDQRDIQILARNREPMFDDVDGLMLYRLDNLEPGKSESISESYIFDRFAVETTIVPARVPVRYDENTELYKVYTAHSPGVPSDVESIRATARAVVGYARNPYTRARMIYDYLLNRLKYDPKIQDPVQALEKKAGDDVAYASLMTAMLRSLGIPARIVSGHIVDDNQHAVPHRWLEFYIQSFGWVPVDPSLPDGALAGNFKLPDNSVEYYFGNLDNRHITFSRGLLEAKRMDPNGRPILSDNAFARESLSEEATGNLKSYRTTWGRLIIIGVY
jgi:transglutaminase-like putative cysteine protease